MTVLAKLVTVYTNDIYKKKKKKKMLMSSFLYMFFLFKPYRLLSKCEVKSL